MIPRRLMLSNFMSYAAGAPEVDFTSFTVACLSGQNGHGKSALLDAITWVLWGEARTHSDHLVRTGETSMMVELDFEVDDKVYRVSRKRSQVRQGQTHTEFQILEDNGTYRSLTGQGERDTQERIKRALRMDYRAFINSAFVLQGRADEFTQQKPTERKDILAEILDLGRYDRLQDLARARQTAAEEAVRTLQAAIARLETEAAFKAEYEASLQEASATQAAASAELAACDAALSATGAELAQVQAQLALLDSLIAQEQQTRKDFADAMRRAGAGREQLARLDEILSRRAEIEQKLQGLLDARAALLKMDEAQQQFIEAERTESRVKAELEKLRHAIEIEKSRVEERLKDLKQRSSGAEKIAREIEDLRKAHRPSRELDEAFERLRAERDECTAKSQAAASGLQSLAAQLEQLERRQALLHDSSAACPLCEQPLEPHGHDRLVAELKKEKKGLQEQQRLFEQEIAAADERHKDIMQRAKRTKAALEAARHAEQDINCLERDALEAQKAAAAIPGVEEQIGSLVRKLGGDVNPALSEQLRAAAAARLASRYDAAQHRSLRDRVRQLQDAERDHQALEDAARRRDDAARQVDEDEGRARTYEQRSQDLQRQTAPFASLKEEKQRLDVSLAQLTSSRTRLAGQVADADQSVGRWTLMVEQCDQRAAEAKERRGEMVAASKDAAIYKELATAFSKRGIQAMIIENVIPEIEEEANRLLSRMTDSGMHIQFRTQKELKKGGGAETLDILIGDEMGDRPYECYSGGEAFRINFAIRIALSRLLARRAGARLQTVVIDEGFGTQDAIGRRRLVEAIEAIKDEFARILVITHLDDIKDEFPVRLHVIKDAGGSRVMVLD